MLVESAPLPEVGQLPDELGELLRLQAMSIGNGDWDTTVALLIREIESVIENSAPPADA